MAFNPQQLTATVYEVYKQKPANWTLTVYTAMQVGYRDINTLTNIAFYLHHPELDGRPLNSNETTLIAEWKAFRTLIQPILANIKSEASIPGGRSSSRDIHFFTVQITSDEY